MQSHMDPTISWLKCFCFQVSDGLKVLLYYDKTLRMYVACKITEIRLFLNAAYHNFQNGCFFTQCAYSDDHNISLQSAIATSKGSSLYVAVYTFLRYTDALTKIS